MPLHRILVAAFAAQLAVAALATLGGWGRSAASPPRMERFGPPPGWQRPYADFDRLAYALLDSRGHEVGVAAWVGVPTDWDAPEPRVQTPRLLHESPLRSLRALNHEDDGYELLVAPRAAALAAHSVKVNGNKYAVSEYVDGGAYVVMTATVDNHDLSAFGVSSASFFETQRPGRRLRLPVVLVREPRDAHALVPLVLDDRGGSLSADAVEGSPVVALTGAKAAVIGYVLGGARSVVPLWRVGARIRAVKGVPAGQSQRPGQGYLGIGLRTVATGVAIDEVVPGSPADIAGLRVGDVIVRHDDAPQMSKEMLRGVLRSDRPYTVHELLVVRGGVRLTVGVRVGERP
jgi:hypothetical protein